jgi:hypothetical protein
VFSAARYRKLEFTRFVTRSGFFEPREALNNTPKRECSTRTEPMFHGTRSARSALESAKRGNAAVNARRATLTQRRGAASAGRRCWRRAREADGERREVSCGRMHPCAHDRVIPTQRRGATPATQPRRT